MKKEIKEKIIRVIPTSFELKEEKKDGSNYRLIKAYVSMFNNVDLVGDIIVQGAFAESIKKKLPSGVWSHNWDEPIAKTIHASEDEKGLYIEAEFVEGVQRSDEAYRLIKAGVIDEFSIGFRILDDEWRDDGVRIIKKAKLYEWSPVLAGANPNTELVSIKSDEAKDEETHEKGCGCGECKTDEEIIDDAIEETKEKAIDFIHTNKYRVKTYFSDGTVKRDKISYKYKKYLVSKSDTKVEKQAEGDLPTKKILKLAKQNIKQNHKLLKILKNK